MASETFYYRTKREAQDTYTLIHKHLIEGHVVSVPTKQPDGRWALTITWTPEEAL